METANQILVWMWWVVAAMGGVGMLVCLAGFLIDYKRSVPCPRCAKRIKKPTVVRSLPDAVEHLDCPKCGLHALRQTHFSVVESAYYTGDWIDRYSNDLIVRKR